MPGSPEPAPDKPPSRKRKPKPPKNLDEAAFPNQKVKSKTETETLPHETESEIRSRLRREESRESHEQFKEKAVLIALLVVTGIVVLMAAGTLIFSDKPNLQSWATAALTGAMAGYFGWFTGKHDGKA